MELGKTEPLRVLNEHHRGVRHVHADLYDSRGDKDMDNTLLEGLHDRLLLFRLHPAVKEAYVPLPEDILLQLLAHVRGAAQAHLFRFLDKGIDDIGLAAFPEGAPY